jgi:hypothetical protein
VHTIGDLKHLLIEKLAARSPNKKQRIEADTVEESSSPQNDTSNNKTAFDVMLMRRNLFLSPDQKIIMIIVVILSGVTS